MSVRIVCLGTARGRNEGTRIGTVRHPPRGVPKDQHAAQNWDDAWLPELAPRTRAPEAGAVSLFRQRVGRVREALPRRDSGAGEAAFAQTAGHHVTGSEFLGWLLLRRRVALPPFGAARAIARMRRRAAIT